jgi:hypothetical protein
MYAWTIDGKGGGIWQIGEKRQELERSKGGQERKERERIGMQRTGMDRRQGKVTGSIDRTRVW